MTEYTRTGTAPTTSTSVYTPRILSTFRDPQNAASYSSPEQIAEVIYQAATDGKDQLIYLAGDDAREWYSSRRKIGDGAFRKGLRQRFFPSAQAA